MAALGCDINRSMQHLDSEYREEDVADEASKDAFPESSDIEIIAKLMRAIVFVAVCWNDVIEDGQDSDDVLERHIFTECDEVAEFFPWPPEC